MISVPRDRAGAGFIGSHTCKALRKAGYFPISYDNLSRGNADAVRWGDLVIGDIADPALLREDLDAFIVRSPSYILPHSHMWGSRTKIRAFITRNKRRQGPATLASTPCHDCGGARISFFFSSSCAVYGVPAVVPTPGNQPSVSRQSLW